MSTQRYISTSFWDDEWVQSLNITEKAVYLYLLTNTLTNIAGVYKISDRRMSFDTSLSMKDVKSILEKFKIAGKAYRFEEYIVIPTWPKHQKWETHVKISTGIEAVLKKLPVKIIKELKKIGYSYPIDSLCIGLELEDQDENEKRLGSNYSDLDLNTDLNSKFDPDINSGSAEDVEKPSSPQNPEKTKKPSLREREPANDIERVEKTYLENWDTLYAQGKVKAINPVVNWNQTRKLLKTHLENLNADLIILAINNGVKDDWIMNTGYSLGTMLSASVLNRLINANDSPKTRIGTDKVPKEKVSSYFKEPV